MSVWYPGRSEEEEEPRVGYPHTAPMGQVVGGRLAREDNQDGAPVWYPSMTYTGEEDPVE